MSIKCYLLRWLPPNIDQFPLLCFSRDYVLRTLVFSSPVVSGRTRNGRSMKGAGDMKGTMVCQEEVASVK